MKKPIRSIVRSLVPDRFYLRLIRIVLNSPLLLSFFYYWKKSFYSEQKGIFAGQEFFRTAERSGEGVVYDLVRNIHRLEKGLSLKNLEPTFAEDYIGRTVSNLEELLKDYPNVGACQDDRLCWALDVLSRYFRTVKTTPATGSARSTFEVLTKRIGYRLGKKYPHARRVEGSTPVSYEALKKLAIQRRSVRWYRRRKVPRKLLDKAIEVAKLSPSACNRQAFEFRIYDDKKLIRKISNLAIGMDGYKENVPCLVALVGDYSAYAKVRDRHLIYIDGSLASMAFQFALETLGLSSCCANWPAIQDREEAIQELLGLSDSQRVVMLISVGYPDPKGLVPHSQKKSLDDIRSFNKL